MPTRRSGRRAHWHADRGPLDRRLDNLRDLTAANARGSKPPCAMCLAHTRRNLPGRGLKDAKRHRYHGSRRIDGELDDDAVRPTTARGQRIAYGTRPIGRATRECCRRRNLELVKHPRHRTALFRWGLGHTRLLRHLNQTGLQEREQEYPRHTFATFKGSELLNAEVSRGQSC